MVVGRVFLLASILTAYVQGSTGHVTLNSIVFFVTLFIPWMARGDERLYYVDFLSMLAFGGFYFVWLIPSLRATDGNILGIDKLFHMSGGACVGLFALILTERLPAKRRVWIVLTTVFVVGLSWELFEWFLGTLPEPFHQTFMGLYDSTWDLVADVLGGALALVRVGRQPPTPF